MALSSLYEVTTPTHDQLVAHIASCRADGIAEGIPVTHTIRIAVESAPFATRQAFVAAAVAVGYNRTTANIQYNYSRQLSKEMEEMDNE